MKKAMMITALISAMLFSHTAYASGGEAWDFTETFDNAASINESFNFHFTVKQYDRRTEKLDKNWILEDGVIKRVGNIDKSDLTVNIAVMTYISEVYDNFELSVDFKAGSETRAWPVIAVMQEIPGKYYLTDGGGAGIFMQQDGKITMWGPIVRGSKGNLYEERIKGAYAANDWHIMRVIVRNSDITVYLDGVEILRSTLNDTDYAKGYVSLISVNNDCSFDNFKIRRLASPGERGNEPNKSEYADAGQSLDDIIKNGYTGAIRRISRSHAYRHL